MHIRDFEGKDGCKFTAKIKSEQVEGCVTIENGRAYLCQNTWDGTSCRNKRGYRYSWVCTDETGDVDFDVSNLKFIIKKDANYHDWKVGDIIVNGHRTAEIILRQGDVVIYKYVDFGEFKASGAFLCEELYRIGWRIIENDIIDSLNINS